MLVGTKNIIVGVFIGVLFYGGLLSAQAVLGFTNGQGFPQVVNVGQGVPLSGWIKNSGNVPFTGSLDIKYFTDSTGAHPIDNNFAVSNLNPGDSILWSKSNYNFPSNVFRLGNNDVLIWPTGPSGGGVVYDSVSISIFYTGAAAFNLRQSSFGSLVNGFHIQDEYNFQVDAINEGAFSNVNDICLYARIPARDPICIDHAFSEIPSQSLVSFAMHDFSIKEAFQISGNETDLQAIEFFVLESESELEPFNIVSLPILGSGVGNAPQGANVLVKVYPNPFEDVLEIDLPLDWRSDAVGRLTDLSGRLVASFALQSGQIDLSNVAAGSYLFEIASRKGTFREQVIRR